MPDCSNDTGSVPDASLSVIEVEAKLRDKVRIKYQDMQQVRYGYSLKLFNWNICIKTIMES